MSYIGWTIRDWVKFHKESTPTNSLALLEDLLQDQDANDAAWISLATKESLQKQWKVLQKEGNKKQYALYGVPVAVKDNIDVEGMGTTAACPAYRYEPSRDATAVKLLREAGAIIIGKTNLDQFATGLVGVRSPYGTAVNSFNKDYVPGGSSSGSASLVGRGIVPVALGTDTAGSGRVPASLNNLIGLKPTKGLISCSGVVPACKSLDCVSIFLLNLEDAQLVFSVLAKSDGDNYEYSRQLPENPLLSFPNRPRLGVPTTSTSLWYGEKENAKLYKSAVGMFSDLGAEIVPVDMSLLIDLAKCLYEGPWVAERYTAIKDFLKTNPSQDSLDKTVISIIQGGEKYTAAVAFDFEYKRNAILQGVSRLLKDIDALILPTCPLTPTKEAVANDPVKINSFQGTYTNFVNLADMSALAIPAGFRNDGLPFGISLVSDKFNDYALLELASRYMKAYGKVVPRFLGSLKHKMVSVGDDIFNRLVINPQTQIKLAVVGAHLKGFQLHWQLEKCKATFLERTKTSRNYRLYALPKTGPVAKPGLRRVSKEGHSIEVEVYSIPVEEFGTFIGMVPEPLGIGTAELESGEFVKSFICEEVGYNAPGTTDISEYGGWRNYQSAIERESRELRRPFRTVLVSNRGEIAVRIIKTLKLLKIKSVAVYSDPDKYAEHVLLADVAIPLQGLSSAETYLDIEKIIRAAKQTNAEAIIPGYGFLSENADFSDRCAKEGIVFVGPTGDAIRDLGLKHSARKIATDAGVPLVPGSDLLEDPKEAKKVASTLGYPVMVKSTAGGGGIGLQKVDSENDFERVFRTVQHQGKSYFGDSGVFLEKFVENARHVEVQMFGDGKGRAIAIGERDCSLQRRNQKIIEETPAPNVSEQVRTKMRNAAESLASSMNYRCAGTVEFIYDEKAEAFYFLEVNARLQVEHPITEMVTGFDLVEWMLCIAAGMSIDFDQKINVTGASMEARLYAENPVKDFMPSPGQLTEVSFPLWARVDTWVKKGTIVSSNYDPTLAKIIVHGRNREEALSKLQLALDETSVYGCITNLDYLKAIVSSEMFSKAKVGTKVLDSFRYEAKAFEILNPGAYTTVQDYPGRKGYWHIGVPPSGCMDEYAFRVANKIVGNYSSAPGLEITLTGPKILFHHETVIAVTGGKLKLDLNGEEVDQWATLQMKKGDVLSIGKLSQGCRVYLAIRGGIDINDYLGSKSTFALGKLGGYNGRVLKYGDVLFFSTEVRSHIYQEVPHIPKSLIPSYEYNSNKNWVVGVTCGPHGAPDFFKKEYVQEFFSEKWKVHYNSNRFGVRLIGPKPKWARSDGGEAGLHPSNAHDYVYSLGAINFTGDEPVILTCDGPSLGGFVCMAVVIESEMPKIGQAKPGDLIQFIPVSYDSAKELKSIQDSVVETLDGGLPAIENYALPSPEDPILRTLHPNNAPKVVYRQAGERYILVEYGDNVFDLNVSYRIHKLISLVNEDRIKGVVEMSRGVRSVLVEYNEQSSQQELLDNLTALEQSITFVNKWQVPSNVIKLPMAFEDQKTLDAVKRYQETIRSTAPWLPNNVDFIAGINGMNRVDVKEMLYTARFLVLGLGDVFLGAPCAVPLDPRQRLLGTKYNPSRTYTPNGTVGIGGMFMCIYTMESPGGYQLVGRTIPIWDKLVLRQDAEKPWLLNPFDQVEFYPVSEDELEAISEKVDAGSFNIDITNSVFDHFQYLQWVQENSHQIEQFQKDQKDKLTEFSSLIQTANAELKSSEAPKVQDTSSFGENAEIIYSEFSGKFWKPLVAEGETVQPKQGLVVIEAMKTEMIVTATAPGKVVKLFQNKGDMVDAGDIVAVIE